MIFLGGNSNLADSGKLSYLFTRMISLVGIQTSLTVVNFSYLFTNDFFGRNSNLADSGKLFLPFYQMISLVGIQTSLTVVNFSYLFTK